METALLIFLDSSGFYNDHHFHYGYHVYAAAIAAHFDENWGRKHFERVVLLLRDYANPSERDRYFPVFRHKDWYQGSSWASGIPLPPFRLLTPETGIS